MLYQDLSFSTTFNPTPFILQWPIHSDPLRKSLFHFPKRFRPMCLHNPEPLSFPHQNPIFPRQLALPPSAGRSKKPVGKIQGLDELRRRHKRNSQRKSKKLSESFFYRLRNPHKLHADNFTEDELQMIGLGYDRLVRFMSQDDPNLKHPYDWYKYGEFGPYSWRGIVVGDPIRGRLSDECVTLIGGVRDHEEWEKIEQYDMAVDYGNKLRSFNRGLGLQHFWVFVRHPKWRLSELPWQQWTLVCEVALEAGNQRLDKWNLMGRLGNKTRQSVTTCAAWMRPDIVYVKKPVYQCRFEPQAQFFKALLPLLDPETEQDYLFELEDDEGRVELCTYFGGLCKIVRVNQKAFVDDVVKGYEKLSDEKKSKCLEFLLMNNPVPVLHPYTKEWKSRLEEMEMGCDAPDDDEDLHKQSDEKEFTDWIESDGNSDDDLDEDEEDDEDVVIDINEGDDELGVDEEEEEASPEEDQKYWEEQFTKAMKSNDDMEKFVKQSVQRSTALYEKQLTAMEERADANDNDDGDETVLRGKKAKVSPQEWKTVGLGPWRKRIKKSKMPPELFLQAAVRPFTYKNLVKEIVLTRHAILEGEIDRSKAY